MTINDAIYTLLMWEIRSISIELNISIHVLHSGSYHISTILDPEPVLQA